STQMTLTSAECIAVAERLGVQRVVLARELSIAEIAEIRGQTSMPLEVFVHGALCVAYSGQCLTSEALGGRSANRGQCAQACRLPYEVICDGADVDLEQQRYLLSPQDLAAYALVPDLLRAGVCSLKIEGRLKTPEYVANITRHYRQAIDAAVAGRPVEFTPRDVEEMELSFSRGFSVGWLQGCDHKQLVPALSSAKRGVRIGTIRAVQRGRVEVALTGSVKAGDGVVFEGDRVAGTEQGGRIFAVHAERRSAGMHVVELEFADGALDPRHLHAGLGVWKTDDPALTRRLQQSFAGEIRGRDLPVRITAEAAVGRPLQLRVEARGLPPFDCASDAPLAAATKHPLTEAGLTTQLGRLGGTGFVLEQLSATITGAPMVPHSVLGLLRRQVATRLAELRDAVGKQRAAHPRTPILPELRRPVVPVTPGADVAAELTVLCRTLFQLRTVLDHGVTQVSADFQDPREFREAVAAARQHAALITLATPRIQKPGEIGLFKAISRHQPDAVLVRNLSGLEYFTGLGLPCIADFSLNAANELTVDLLLQLGAQRVTPSFDLNREQLLALAGQTSPNLLEVVLHQHMPLFHMEHCVFCAVLSPGTNKTNCGRPCDDHNVLLRDRIGAEHPLKADVGCRNTVFNAVPQSSAEVAGDLQALGVRRFRIELLQDAPAAELTRLVDLYRDLLAGRIAGREVWTSLKALNRVGVTRGT
ncbi:MAG: U32 family peptidase, partial [Planctomycetaceae bacterium]|nr:U32 family peptidase [Planctomycetaceae bacterium]